MIEFTNKETTTTLRFWKETCGSRCLARRTATSRRAGRPVALYWHFGFAFASCPKRGQRFWWHLICFHKLYALLKAILIRRTLSVATAVAQKNTIASFMSIAAMARLNFLHQLTFQASKFQKLRFAQSARKKLKNILPNNLVKLQYFTNPDFPEIREFPLLNHLLSWGRVRSL